MDQVNECLMDVSEDCLTSALLSFRYPSVILPFRFRYPSVMQVKLHTLSECCLTSVLLPFRCPSVTLPLSFRYAGKAQHLQC